MNTARFTITIVAPVGVENKYESISPVTNENIETNMLIITTLLNFLKICIEVKVGKMIKLDIKSAPINLIPSTTTTEHRQAKSIL